MPILTKTSAKIQRANLYIFALICLLLSFLLTKPSKNLLLQSDPQT